LIEVEQSWPTFVSETAADYLIIDLSGALLSLFVINSSTTSASKSKRLYSALKGEKDGLMQGLYDGLSKGKAQLFSPATALDDTITPEIDQCWLNLETFAAHVRSHFGPGRVLLVRSAVHLFWWDGRTIAARQRGAALIKARRFLMLTEERFARITACDQILLADHWLPNADRALWDTTLSSDYLLHLSLEICRRLEAPVTALSSQQDHSNDRLAEQIYLASQSDPTEAHKSATATSKRLLAGAETVYALTSQIDNDFTNDSICLDCDADLLGGLRLRDAYVADLVTRNSKLVESYELSKIPQKLLRQVSVDDSSTVLWLDGNSLLVVTYDENQIRVRKVCMASSGFRWESIDESRFTFPLDVLLNVLESWPLHFERARHGATEPFRLRIDDKDQLLALLGSVDLGSILRWEELVLTIGDDVADRGYDSTSGQDRATLSLLFRPGAYVVCLRNGLGDQWYYYALSAILCDLNAGIERFPVLDDLGWDDDPNVIASPHVHANLGFVSANLPRMSQMVSPWLRWSRLQMRKSRPRDDRSEYYALGFHESMLVTHPGRLDCIVRHNFLVTGNLLVLTDFPELKAWFCSIWEHVPVIDIYAKVLPGFSEVVPELKSMFERCTMPARELIPKEICGLAEAINSCSAVVLHVRRGDYVDLGMARDPAEYRDGLSGLVHDAQEHGYTDFQLFVFSDDLQYVNRHEGDYGITDLFSPDVVHYVSEGGALDQWNLMRMGKFILATNSGFVTTAALSSSDVQAIYGLSPLLDGTIWRRTEGLTE